MPPSAWHARLRPRSFARVQRLSFSFSKDAVTGEGLDPLASFAISRRCYNATTLVKCVAGGWMTDPFTGQRISRRDERVIRACAESRPWTVRTVRR